MEITDSSDRRERTAAPAPGSARVRPTIEHAGTKPGRASDQPATAPGESDLRLYVELL
jgi:hypothetical protein